MKRTNNKQKVDEKKKQINYLNLFIHLEVKKKKKTKKIV